MAWKSRLAASSASKSLGVIRSHVAECHGSRSQAVQIAGRRPLTKASHENGLDRLANLENVADEIVVDAAHPGALMGTGDDEALALQSPKGLPDRIGAHPIARGKLFRLQPRAGFENPRHDISSKIAGDAMGKAGVFGH